MQHVQNNYIDNIVALTASKTKEGLKQIKKYLTSTGNTHEALSVFHVAGTNGKGSTAHMITQVLWKQFGKKVGLFTSPHLLDITERIQINGQCISHERLNTLIGEVYEETKNTYHFSYFELLTLVAVRYFIAEGVDYAVFEVGLGGTHDSTNIRTAPLATYITSLGMDHKDILGPRASQIQWNKMGIMKESVTCYTTVDNQLMHWGAKKKKAHLCIIHNHIPTNLLGEHQEKNAALVYHSLVNLGYDKDLVKQGLLSIDHPGRLQFIRPTILVDGAHNAQGIQALHTYIQTIQPQWKKIITLFGSSKTLEEVQELTLYLLQGNENWLTQPSVYRGLDPNLYKQYVALDPLHAIQSPKMALKKILPRLTEDTLLVIYGSLYLVGEVLGWEKEIESMGYTI